MRDDFKRPERHSTTRQPVVVVIIAVAAGILCDRFASVPAESWWILGLVGWVAWTILIRVRVPYCSSLALLLAVGFSAGCWHGLLWNGFGDDDLGRFARLDRQPVCVEAIACETPRRVPAPAFDPMRALPTGERSRVEVEVRRLRDGRDWRDVSGRATLLVDGHVLGVQSGDHMRVFAQLSRTVPAMNPGEFDFAKHARRDGQLCVLQTSYPDSVVPLDNDASWSPSAAIDQLQSRGNEQLWQELSHEQSGLAAAIMLGTREQLGRDWNEAFFQTGTVHLMAISGLHVGMLAMGLLLMLRWLMVRENHALVVVAVACTIYVLVTDARPPAVRALIIVLVMCLGRALGRQTNSWNTLALAGIVVLVLNPTELFRTGTQLSFLAVAVLIWLATTMLCRPEATPLERLIRESRPWWVKAAKSCGRWTVCAIVASTAIWLITLPLVMARFHLIPTVGLFLGPLLAIPVAVALMSGFLLLAVGWIWPLLAAIPAWVCDKSLALVQAIVGRSHEAALSHAWVAGPETWWLVGFYGILATFLVLQHRRPSARWCVAIVAMWIAVGFAAGLPRTNQQDRLACTFISVGHGSCVLVELPDGRNLLYDAGRLGAPESAARSISSYLWHRGITHLDAVIVSHADVDHYNALPELLRRFDIGVAYVSPVMFEEPSNSVVALKTSLSQSEVPIRELWLGDRLATDVATEITVMHPPRAGVLGSDNANSIVLLIEYAGRRILLPGDLEDLGMIDLLAEPPVDCDVVLAPHHGSGRSNPPGFAAWCQPEWTIVSGGLGRSSLEVTQAYQDAGSRVLHSARTGAIRCVIQGGELTVESMHEFD